MSTSMSVRYCFSANPDETKEDRRRMNSKCGVHRYHRFTQHTQPTNQTKHPIVRFLVCVCVCVCVCSIKIIGGGSGCLVM